MYLPSKRRPYWWTFYEPIKHFPASPNKQIDDDDDNNKAVKSETSWDRLELKPSRSNQGSGTWIAVFEALLSKAKSLDIFHPFKSPFIASTQVNFGLSLSLFMLLSWLRIPLRTGVSRGLTEKQLKSKWNSLDVAQIILIYVANNTNRYGINS